MTTELYCCDTACSVGDAIEVLASFSTPRAEPGIVGLLTSSDHYS